MIGRVSGSRRVTWRSVLACGISAFVGALGAIAWMSPANYQQLSAQDRGPALPGPTRPAARTPANEVRGAIPAHSTGALFLSDGLTPEEQINVNVYERVNKCVANITTKTIRAEGFFTETAAEGAGSGSVIDKAGHILTNYHVVEDARQVSVTLFDGKTYDAAFVGADPINDVAIIK